MVCSSLRPFILVGVPVRTPFTGGDAVNGHMGHGKLWCRCQHHVDCVLLGGIGDGVHNDIHDQVCLAMPAFYCTFHSANVLG